MNRGDIFLASLYPSKGAEPGKTRPVLIYQTNMLTSINHPTTIIIPLTTNLADDAFPLRYRIEKRDLLDSTSECLIDQLRAIDNQRILPQKLTSLSEEELLHVDEMVMIVLGIEI